jgi:hypothetical protein
MNDIRLRGPAVAGNNTGGRQIAHNHARIARNLRRSRRNAAVDARLIQAERLDSQSAAQIANAAADALSELAGSSAASTDIIEAIMHNSMPPSS